MINSVANSLSASGPRKNADMMVADIRQAIRAKQLRPGERLLPLRRLAEQYGVSFGTATAAIGELEREGLVVKRAGSGTFVTADLDEATSRGAGLVQLWLPLTAHVYQELANALLGRLQQTRIETRANVWREDGGPEQAAELMQGWDTAPPRALVTEWEFRAVAELKQRGLPPGMRAIAVFGDPQDMPPGWHSVNPDRVAMAELAVEHLARKGHRRIGFVTYSGANRLPEQVPRFPAAEWYALPIAALRAAMRERGLEDLAVYHGIQFGMLADSAAITESQMESCRRWLSGPDRPTAVVGDDSRLMVIKRIAEEMSMRVPQDLDLLGFGNTSWSHAAHFSSISYSPDLIARQAIVLIQADDEELEGASRHVVVSPKLVVR